MQTYVERDVRLLENIEDLSKFGRFIALIAALTSQEINYSQLGRELGISPKTAERWLNLLIHTYQWTELQPFNMNSIKRLSLKPKGIFTDTGLACYLQRISSPEALSANPMHEAFFESYCFNWHTFAGAEVDIMEFTVT